MARSDRSHQPSSDGLGVDARGNPVIDPTRNVLDLVAAAIERQDDLRASNVNLFQAIIEGVQKYVDIKIDGDGRLSRERHEFTRRELVATEARRIEHKKDTQEAVNNAFSAAKELMKELANASDKAIAKSEATVNGQIAAVLATVADIKDRVVQLETQKATTVENRGESRSSIGVTVGVVGSIIGAATVLLAILALVLGARG